MATLSGTPSGFWFLALTLAAMAFEGDALLATRTVCHRHRHRHAPAQRRAPPPVSVHIDEGFSDEDDYWFETDGDGDVDAAAERPSRYVAEPLLRSVVAKFLGKWKDSRIAADSPDCER